MSRRQLLVVVVLLTGACTGGPPESAPSTRMPVKQPSLINEDTRPENVLHFVRDVLDARTVELADGTAVRVAQLAAPPDCWSAGALAFARSTLLASAVRINRFLSGEVNLTLEDGTDYALLAVQRGVLRAEGADGGPLISAETEAAAANRGLWGPPCNGLDAAPPLAAPPIPNAPGTPGTPGTTTRAALPPQSPTTTEPRPTTTQPRPTTTTPRPPARVCAVAYRVTNQWPGGFQASVTVRNTGTSTINGWTLRWSFADGQTVDGMWNATSRQSGATVNAVNANYNPQIAPGASVQIGFNGSVRGRNSVPGVFALNGEACTVE
ncbi:cellulose-binding domain-containing protein [Lentzea aerocolonigenes]|uniref:cellulose-binding domain-containing protein n=1 Tax=Lentzea aerocolonigenes TaxID=68170 RepID=UPI00191C5109|nr:cellulose-binding domain-containing protein [Lentzea aerocolonigenes]